jgi:hypothetical protein
MLIAGCSGNQGGGSFDARSGFVSKSYQADAGALTPNAIRLDSKYQNYYMYDHLVFVGQQDSTRYALTVTLGRGLADNKFVRAERDFAGFLFAGKSWVTLPYTRMKHDSTRLDLSYPCLFGGLRWTEPYTGGVVTYDRHDIKFELKFNGLRPVQSLKDGETKLRSHAIGEATLTLPTRTVSGKVFYELAQLEGYNPLVNVNTGIDFINYDWIACASTSGENLLCSADTSTESNRLFKNFVAVSGADGLRYAEGADRVRIASDMIQRDRNIYDYLALRKGLTIPDLGVDLKLNLTDNRIFYTTGYCLAIVEGVMSLDNRSEKVWGVLEHRQKPKSSGEVLK